MLRGPSRARVRDELRTRLAFRFSDLPMATRAARGANGTQHGAVRLVLLGTPRLELPDGNTVPLERLMAALLAKLAIDGPVPRAAAARLLWPTPMTRCAQQPAPAPVSATTGRAARCRRS
jgi:hypothetical protein